jgi:hypothetical protein
MNTNKENFKLWFCNVIESLYGNKNAGFSILMLTFPLLERYLRSKSNTPENSVLGPPFYDELVKLFPVLKDNVDNITAKNFWQVYRNGILHQATLSQRDNKGIKMPDGWLSGEKKDIEIDQGAFWVNPVEFTRRVIDIIDKDFSNFEAPGSSSHPLAIEQSSSDGFYGTSGSGTRMPSSIINQCPQFHKQKPKP